jgi:hypothetical protein
MELIELAKSKINLYLNLSGKKANGFHNLISFICFGNFSDKLLHLAIDKNSKGKIVFIGEKLITLNDYLKNKYKIKTINLPNFFWHVLGFFFKISHNSKLFYLFKSTINLIQFFKFLINF